jgi:hypothetical protein
VKGKDELSGSKRIEQQEMVGKHSRKTWKLGTDKTRWGD